ncbi:MAG: hypothetical protein KKB51_22285 [Candidatus Riflebacteria bacterium]|nr:hypothetical protein [Candidatus Riflebacteria bacterium]
MRKLSASLIFSAICGLFLVQPGLFQLQPLFAQEQKDDSSSSENAEILFAEALELKQAGNIAGAIDSFARAIKIDRSILANDDQGLIEALKKDCEEKLKAAPDDVKVLELLGFVFAVCYSDNESAIACYEKVYNLVDDEQIKDRTSSLIERLKLSAEVQQNYQQEVTAQLRDERLKSWSEMERVNRFGEEAANIQDKSAKLADAYKSKDELANRVPQLEQELKELQDEYEKANRLFHTLSDNGLYERRRRRLKDDIAEKEKEVGAAKGELQEAESAASTLEKELASVQQKKEESPIRSYDDKSGNGDSNNPDAGGGDLSDNNSGTLPAEGDDVDSGSNNDDSGSSSGEEQSLPTPDNPDFPPDSDEGGSSGASSSAGGLDDLIDNL